MFLLSQDMVVLMLLDLGDDFIFWIIHMDLTVQCLQIIMEDECTNPRIQCK